VNHAELPMQLKEYDLLEDKRWHSIRIIKKESEQVYKTIFDWIKSNLRKLIIMKAEVKPQDSKYI
jgi:hypothetical protein